MKFAAFTMEQVFNAIDFAMMIFFLSSHIAARAPILLQYNARYIYHYMYARFNLMMIIRRRLLFS